MKDVGIFRRIGTLRPLIVEAAFIISFIIQLVVLGEKLRIDYKGLRSAFESLRLLPRKREAARKFKKDTTEPSGISASSATKNSKHSKQSPTKIDLCSNTNSQDHIMDRFRENMNVRSALYCGGEISADIE